VCIRNDTSEYIVIQDANIATISLFKARLQLHNTSGKESAIVAHPLWPPGIFLGAPSKLCAVRRVALRPSVLLHEKQRTYLFFLLARNIARGVGSGNAPRPITQDPSLTSRVTPGCFDNYGEIFYFFETGITCSKKYKRALMIQL
jgi:hypothetical protein